MKRAAWLLILLLPVLAAADCFDFAAWRQAVTGGEFDLARQMIDRAVSACSCASEDAECLTLPGRVVPVSPRFLREMTARFADWTAQLAAACGSLPESNDDDRRKKLACHQQRAGQFAEGLRGEHNGAAFADLPAAVAGRLTRSLGLSSPETTPQTTPLNERYSAEAMTVGQQICALSRKLQESEDLLEQVHRRGNFAPNERRRREIELEKAIKALHEQISALKRQFEHLTGESFDPISFCGGE